MQTEVDTGTNELLCEISDRICHVTLNRPDKKNALSRSLTPAIRKILADMEKNKAVKCIIISGAGEAFCAGGDIGGMNENAKKGELDIDYLTNDLIQKQEELTLRLYELPIPTIAVIPGPAAGAGLCLALACDFRFMASSTFLTTAYRNIALSGDYGGTWLLPRLVGMSKAKDLFFTGRRVSAEESYELGLVDRVYKKDILMSKAKEFAETLAAGPRLALGRMKKNINNSQNLNLKDSMRVEAINLIKCMDETDHKEAVKAFLEKKAPTFA